jgi:hypothetical protein
MREVLWFEDVLDYKEKSQQPDLILVAILPESQNDELLKAIFDAKRTPVIIDNVHF